MKNFEKYTTAEERSDAFHKYCKEHPKCFYTPPSAFNWLDLEAEEDEANPLSCPFCGGKTVANHGYFCEGLRHWVECTKCMYRSANRTSMEDAIAVNNRVARAVMEAKEREDVSAN